jgi:DNA-nicking Smr family endonuclease
MPKIRPRPLRDDELRLWRRVAETATPLRRPVPQHPVIEPAPPEPAPLAKSMPVVPDAGFRIGERADPAGGSVRPLPPPRLDARLHARLRRGKQRPEARIDLHGLTLTEAHDTLIGFVQRAHGGGKRLLLVITGKGQGSFGGQEGRGILRRQVPHWLRLPPLSATVLDIIPAHRTHGGDGAFYVYLCRGRG